MIGSANQQLRKVLHNELRELQWLFLSDVGKNVFMKWTDEQLMGQNIALNSSMDI